MMVALLWLAGTPTLSWPSTAVKLRSLMPFLTDVMVRSPISNDAASLVDAASEIVAVPVRSPRSSSRPGQMLSRVQSSAAGGSASPPDPPLPLLLLLLLLDEVAVLEVPGG